jgi:type IV fimbrial biogenesis protein FimT
MSSMIMARSEAIKRNANVTVTPTGGSWLNGWTVNAGGSSVLSQSTLGGGVSVTCYANGAAVAPCPNLTYTSNGRLIGAAAPSIQLNSTETTSVDTRCISIDLSGRPNSRRANCP